jgi:hypothetical protein
VLANKKFGQKFNQVKFYCFASINFLNLVQTFDLGQAFELQTSPVNSAIAGASYL